MKHAFLSDKLFSEIEQIRELYPGVLDHLLRALEMFEIKPIPDTLQAYQSTN